MGKWAHRLAAHIADEETLRTPTEVLPKLPNGASVSSGSAPRGVHEEISSAANDPAPAAPRLGIRRYRLDPAAADAAHREPWGDAACARFAARVALFLRRGIQPADADALADACHLRDVQAGAWGWCVECVHLSGRPRTWRCGKHRPADVGRDLPDEMAMHSANCPARNACTLATFRSPASGTR